MLGSSGFAAADFDDNAILIGRAAAAILNQITVEQDMRQRAAVNFAQAPGIVTPYRR